MSDSSTDSTADWRDDPGWRPVQYDTALYSDATVPEKPTTQAELASPPIWASLYEGRRIVVTWWRPRATIVPT